MKGEYKDGREKQGKSNDWDERTRKERGRGEAYHEIGVWTFRRSGPVGGRAGKAGDGVGFIGCKDILRRATEAST